jgi:hypothetical protein
MVDFGVEDVPPLLANERWREFSTAVEGQGLQASSLYSEPSIKATSWVTFEPGKIFVLFSARVSKSEVQPAIARWRFGQTAPRYANVMNPS